MKYPNYQRNHVILPGRGDELKKFLKATVSIGGKTVKHKWENGFSSNSEDALTWSCFDVLRNLPHDKITQALDEMMEDAYDGKLSFSFSNDRNINIHIGKRYETESLPEKESTEVDASVETDSFLFFIEAKLYGTIELPDDRTHKYDQIIKKLRVGLEVASRQEKIFYFIFLDLAPMDKMLDYGKKALNAEYFKHYKYNNNNLYNCLYDITISERQTFDEIAFNMGWLTWASLFKTILRAVVAQ
ncbi:hypothetical protein EZS27_027030 [termite gut metagenome]|uniref:Uncharacterized protein n=1 Tax=termite gut metagenome TaxID=433724 RepID=A0A5J4QNJ4_9ZZZZ